MKHFNYTSATSYEEAAELLREGNTVLMAGGSDLIGVLKDKLLPDYPEHIVSLGAMSDSAYIEEDEKSYRIGAMTKLNDLAENGLLKSGMPILPEAAHSIASPLIRNSGTVGGNLCQDVRCWFYRYPDIAGGALNCVRKGGEQCYAIHGDNRYHSVYGGMKAGTPPCKEECPAGTDIPGYMEQLRIGNMDRAAEILMRVNPMPMFTGRVCAHTCQSMCNQNKYGDSVNIHACERTLGEYILANAEKFYAAPQNETNKKVGIIGSGPGGLAAAYFLRKSGHQVVVYDKMEKAGGLMRYGIPRYRLPKEIVDNFIMALEGMGIQFVLNTTVGKDILVEELEGKYDSIYFGTGAWKQPILGIKEEKLAQFGLDFLVEVNSFLKGSIGSGNSVLVCGGGNVAMDVALTATRLGAKHVKLVCLEKASEMPATPEEVERAIQEGVEIINGKGLSRILSEDGKIIGLEVKACLSVFNETGRFDPVYDESDKQIIQTDCIILATGQRVDLDFLGEKYASQLKSQRGLIDVDLDTYKTKRPGIYAGGDVVLGPSVAVKAIRAGRKAAMEMNRDFGMPTKPAQDSPGFISFNPDGVKLKEANKEHELSVEKRTLTTEDTASLATKELEEEAARCMNCGCYSVNASDLSPVLVALDAIIKTTKKEIKAVDFFTTTLKTTDMLDPDEIITEIIIDKLNGYQSSYKKFRMRNTIDFAMASIAYAYKIESGFIKNIRVVLGGVAPVPLRLTVVEALLQNQAPSESLAREAAALAVEKAAGIGHNDYKIREVGTFVERMVLSMA